jgi:hypothetical protein
MERRAYWLVFAARLGEAGGVGCPAQAIGLQNQRLEPERISIIWGGRQLSPEAYLAVPTVLRLGLRPVS